MGLYMIDRTLDGFFASKPRRTLEWLKRLEQAHVRHEGSRNSKSAGKRTNKSERKRARESEHRNHIKRASQNQKGSQSTIEKETTSTGMWKCTMYKRRISVAILKLDENTHTN